MKQNLTEHAYCLLSGQDDSTQELFFSANVKAPLTLHQGQGHQTEHEHTIIYAMHNSTIMPSFNATESIFHHSKSMKGKCDTFLQGNEGMGK